MSSTADLTRLILTEEWRSWEPDAKRALLDRLAAARVAQLQAGWAPYPWQRPHEHPAGREPGPCGPECMTLPDLPPLPAHHTWLLMGGRGTGKTDGGSHYVLDHVAGPPCDTRVKGGHRIAIVAPTLGDAVESCVNGPSGLKAYDPRVVMVGATGGTFVRFHGGAEAKLFGAHSPGDVDRLRSGGNRCLVWLEEAAAMRQLAGVLEHSRLGLRVGPRPHYVATTTPRPRPEVVKLANDPRTHLTRGRTDQASHLDAAVLQALHEMYAGTRLGQQELDGDLLTDVEGALWRLWLIDRDRLQAGTEPDLRRVVVAVDPNAGGPDECGIVVTGASRERMPDRLGRPQLHGYVLADESGHFRHPGEWGEAAVTAYRKWGADAVVAEVNNGGDMVGHVIHTADPTVRYRSVRATRGKARRAEPVVALYEQARVHHVGAFPRLEDQMTTWTEDSDWSPDRMDAVVWGLTDLLLRTRAGKAGAA